MGFRSRGLALALAGVPLLLAPSAVSQSTTRVNLSSLGSVGDQGAEFPALSADGRFVAFATGSSNFARADANGDDDVFVHDRWTGVTECISVTPLGSPGDGRSGRPWLSADGRFVAFWSTAADLVPGDTNGQADAFLRDRRLARTVLVSVASDGTLGNDLSTAEGVSDDGRYVCFESLATNLVPGDSNGGSDVFLRDRATGSTFCVSVTPSGAVANGLSSRPRLSADGRRVAFDSRATDLLGSTSGGFRAVYMRDMITGQTAHVSLASSSDYWCGSISGDGNAVGYWGGLDTTGGWDVYVFDVSTGSTTEVSVSSQGASSDAHSSHPVLSFDGQRIVFSSLADNLVPDDVNTGQDHFLRDRSQGTTEIISLTAQGGQLQGPSHDATLSADGRHAAFVTAAADVVPYPGTDLDVYARDLQGCVTTLASFCEPTPTSLPRCVASIGATGSPSLSAPQGFTITAGPVPGDASGMLLWTLHGPGAQPLGSANTMLCLGIRVHRGPRLLAGGSPGACDGRFTATLAEIAASAPIEIEPGALLHVQAWIRDPDAPGGLALSDALWTQLCP